MNKAGWVPDLPDFRDKLYQDVFKLAAGTRFPIREWISKFLDLFRKKRYPSMMDLRTTGCMPPVFNQGELGACVENAWAGALAYLEAKENGGQPGASLSRLFLYYNVRGGKPIDSGSSIRAGIKSVASQGICKEALWPYDLNTWQNKPTEVAYADASKRRKIQYARLITFDDMMDCLAQGYPFVGGISLYQQFDEVKSDGIVRMPEVSDAYLGGHAVCFVGWDEKRQAFLCRNSWGANWGMNGHFWIPATYVCNPFMADDFWTCRYIPEVP